MEYTDPVKNRVKRMEGQLRGILKMMEEEKDCKAVITQLSAVRASGRSYSWCDCQYESSRMCAEC